MRRDGQKVLLSIKNMGGESKAAWAAFLGDLDALALKRPEFAIIPSRRLLANACQATDGAPGLEV